MTQLKKLTLSELHDKRKAAELKVINIKLDLAKVRDEIDLRRENINCK